MAKNLSNRTANIKNLRSKALNSTKKKQGLNLQVVKLDNGSKVRVSTKELRTMKKAA
jgi:ribosomal protein L28